VGIVCCGGGVGVVGGDGWLGRLVRVGGVLRLGGECGGGRTFGWLGEWVGRESGRREWE